MVLGAIFKKGKNGEYLTDKNGEYVIDQPESEKLLKNAFSKEAQEEKQAMDILEAELKKAEKDHKNN